MTNAGRWSLGMPGSPGKTQPLGAPGKDLRLFAQSLSFILAPKISYHGELTAQLQAIVHREIGSGAPAILPIEA